MSQLTKSMMRKRIQVERARLLVLTFKENYTEMRNTRVAEIVGELEEYDCRVEVYGPWVDADRVEVEYGIEPVTEPMQGSYDAIALAVVHQRFKATGTATIHTLGKSQHILYDLKSFPAGAADIKL